MKFYICTDKEPQDNHKGIKMATEELLFASTREKLKDNHVVKEVLVKDIRFPTSKEAHGYAQRS